MIWSLIICLSSTLALDTATELRKSYSPFVFYNFVDADVNNSVTSAADQAGHKVINFGNMVLNPTRASWLRGRPGVALKAETSLGISTAMASANFYQTAWNGYFTAPFVVEIWYESQDPYESSAATFFSLSRTTTKSGTTGASAAKCNITEPHMDFLLDSSVYFRAAVESNPPAICHYDLGMGYSQYNNPKVVAVCFRYEPVSATFTYYKYEGNETTIDNMVGTVKPLKWQDSLAKLLFSSSNNYGTLNFNLLSFAIYPNLDESKIKDLFKKGLPNAKPVVPSFARAVPEITGGTIQLCSNIDGNSRDSDCLDYTNNAAQFGLNQVHSLMPSERLSVTILSLPSKGTLFHSANVAIINVPFVLPASAKNKIQFTPAPGDSSWYANWTQASGYGITKDDYATFTYKVTDPDGAESNVGTVTIEVFPVHTPPNAGSLGAATSTLYAGRSPLPTGLDNSIILSLINNEYIKPSKVALTCAGIQDLSICTNSKDTPIRKSNFATIKRLPTNGTLMYKVGVTILPVTLNMQIPADTFTNCGSTTPPCDSSPSWIVYYYIPINAFNSTSEVLTSDYFMYSTTTKFDAAIIPRLGQTRYVNDATQLPWIVNFSESVESLTDARVDFDVKNGFYASSRVSVVKQHNLTTITPQNITLFAEDLTVQSPNIKMYIASLPSKGGLFKPGNSTPIGKNELPYALSGSVIGYQPSLPSEPYGFSYGANYASFDFYAVSAGKSSNVARQVINVDNTNDAVTITWSPNTPPIAFKRTASTSQSWSDLPQNQLLVNFTDPDALEPNEPYYQVTIESDFSVFLSPASYNEIQIGKAQNLGQQNGAGAAGAGSKNWIFIVPRDVARRALNSIRVRVDKVTEDAQVTVKIKDCYIAGTLTDSKFDNADWTPIEVSAVIEMQGLEQDKALEYQGVADPTIVGVIIGVGCFIGLVFLICAYLICRWALRRKGASGGGGPSAPAKTGSTSSKAKGKGKKAKSAYLHQVELD